MDEGAQAYFQSVERHFIDRRGAPLLLSPTDVARVAAWHAGGVPLEAVLEGIDVHFDRLERRGRSTRRAVTLSYVDDDVTDAWLAAKRRRLGRSRTPAGTSVAEGDQGAATLRDHARFVAQLEQAAASLGAGTEAEGDPGRAFAPRLQAAAKKLAAKAELFDPSQAAHDEQRAEDHLRRLERSLLNAAREAVGAAGLAAIDAQVEAELAPRRERMQEVAIARVSAALVDKRLRERFGLPRLSLFYT